jgi:hypothetical protein
MLVDLLVMRVFISLAPMTSQRMTPTFDLKKNDTDGLCLHATDAL